MHPSYSSFAPRLRLHQEKVNHVYRENLDYKGLSSYHFWPFQPPNSMSFDTRHGGTEYFLMSTATLLNVGVMSNELVVGELTNTR
jgi:hypothetical protein